MFSSNQTGQTSHLPENQQAKKQGQIDQRAAEWARIYVNDDDPERKRLALASLQKNYPGQFGEHGLDIYTQALVETMEAQKNTPEFDAE